MKIPNPLRVAIYSENDIILSREQGRKLAESVGILGSDLVLISTLISEMARKIVEHPLPGEITISIHRESGWFDIVLSARIFSANESLSLEFQPGVIPMVGIQVTCSPDQTTLRMRARTGGEDPAEEYPRLAAQASGSGEMICLAL